MIKKFFLFIILFSINILFTYWYNTDDYIKQYEEITYSNNYDFVLPSNVNFVLSNFCIIVKNWTWSLLLIDDSTTFLNKDFNVWECFSNNIIIKNDINIVNNTTDYIWVYFDWYYINEWDVFNIQTEKDYFTIFKIFLSNEDWMQILSLLIVWIMVIYLVYLDIKWGFKAGVLFYKKNVLWKN